MKNRHRVSDSHQNDAHLDDIELLPRQTKRSNGITNNAGSKFRQIFRSEYADAKPDEPRFVGWKTILAAVVMFTASIVSSFHDLQVHLFDISSSDFVDIRI